jgi:predicted Zn-dependent protease
MFSTHPSPEQRISDLEKYARELTENVEKTTGRNLHILQAQRFSDSGKARGLFCESAFRRLERDSPDTLSI